MKKKRRFIYRFRSLNLLVSCDGRCLVFPIRGGFGAGRIAKVKKKQVGCEKGITPQRRRLRVIMDEGAQNGERKGRGFFRHQVRSRLFFIFFDLYFFFFVSFLLLFMEPGRWACLFVRLLRACRDP